jgi:hypothetical protein
MFIGNNRLLACFLSFFPSFFLPHPSAPFSFPSLSAKRYNRKSCNHQQELRNTPLKEPTLAAAKKRQTLTLTLKCLGWNKRTDDKSSAITRKGAKGPKAVPQFNCRCKKRYYEVPVTLYRALWTLICKVPVRVSS